MDTAKRKFDAVTVKTFNKWPFKDDFTVSDFDDNGMILKLECNVCPVHLTAIRQEAVRRQIRGSVLSGIQNYADGIGYVHKGNILRHIKAGGLHDWAKRKFMVGTSPQTNSTSGTSTSSSSSNTVAIDVALNSASRKHYVHMFISALSVAMHERPFSDFNWLIENLRKNGVKLLSGKENEKACKEFVTYLSDALISDIISVLDRSNFFAALMDGSQARKTKDEKELIFAKVVVNGSPVELLLACQHMSDFGGENANGVKAAFDAAFLNSFEVPVEKYAKRLTSICADGASVNMGGLTGACTQIKNEYDRDWMLIIHCTNHRLELAIKDAFHTDKAFSEIDEIMCQIYYMFNNSGKAKRLVKKIAKRIGVTFVSFVKATGTRFQNHKLRATKAMVINFLPLCIYAEKMVENPKYCPPDTVAKLRGYLRKFLSYSFLASLHFYIQVLSATAHLSYVMQTKSALITDVLDGIENTKDKLQEISESDADLPFESTVNEDDSVTITAQGTNLPASIALKDKTKMTDKQKKRSAQTKHVYREEYTLTKVQQGKQTVARIKEHLLPAISAAIDKRFQSFLDDSAIYRAVLITDHSTWDFDDDTFGRDSIAKLAAHFKTPLSRHGFMSDLAVREFQQLKKIVGQKYRSFKNKLSLWETIFTHYGSQFPHFLLLIELCLTVAYSSATVERCFSTTRRILTDRRTNLRKTTLNSLLLLRTNVPVMTKLDPAYEEKLVSKSVEKYMSGKGRYRLKQKTAVRPLEGAASEDTFLPVPFNPESTLLGWNPNLTTPTPDESEESDSSDESLTDSSTSDSEGEESDFDMDE